MVHLAIWGKWALEVWAPGKMGAIIWATGHWGKWVFGHLIGQTRTFEADGHKDK